MKNKVIQYKSRSEIKRRDVADIHRVYYKLIPAIFVMLFLLASAKSDNMEKKVKDPSAPVLQQRHPNVSRGDKMRIPDQLPVPLVDPTPVPYDPNILSVKVPYVTSIVNADHKYWKEMISTLKTLDYQEINQFNERDYRTVYDLAHLIIKEVEGESISDDKKTEIYLIPLSVRNRVGVSSIRSEYRSWFGDPDYQSTIFRAKGQFNPFDKYAYRKDNQCLTTDSMKNFYSPYLWETAVKAAATVYTRHEADILPPELLREDIVLYRAPYAHPEWAQDPRYIWLGRYGGPNGHYFYADSQIKRSENGSD